MKKNISIFSISFYLLTVVLLFQGCGGGGSDSPSSTVTPPADNITGTYSLKAVTVGYSNGVIVTEKNVPISGTLKLGSQTFSVSITINNNTISTAGTCSVTYTQGRNAGIVHLTNSTGTANQQFSISGNQLTMYSTGESNGLRYEEWDIWEKTSDSVESDSGESIGDQNVESLLGAIGKIIIDKKIIGN